MDVIYYGVGAEPAGAFDNANRGAERYAAARSDTTMNQPTYRGFRYRSTPGYLNRYAILCTIFLACADSPPMVRSWFLMVPARRSPVDARAVRPRQYLHNLNVSFCDKKKMPGD